MNDDENMSGREVLNKIIDEHAKRVQRNPLEFNAMRVVVRCSEELITVISKQLKSTQELITAIDKQLEASNNLSKKMHILTWVLVVVGILTFIIMLFK
jgi:hypothetical protein